MSDIKLDVRVYPIDEPKGNTVAFASVAIDDLAAIRGVRVVDSDKKGLFVTMPQSKDKGGDYHDIAFPLNGDLRKAISESVLSEYERTASLNPEQRGYDKTETGGRSAEGVKIEVKVYPIEEPKGSTLAFASVSLDDILAIRGVRVVDSDKGGFVSMPQSKDKDGDYHDVAFPLSGDLRKEISKAILDEYKVAEKSADRGKSLADGLRDGKEKAAAHTAVPRTAAAKSRHAGLE